MADSSILEKLKQLKQELQQDVDSRSSSLDSERDRLFLKENVDFLLSASSAFVEERIDCFALLFRAYPAAVKSRLKDVLVFVSLNDDDRSVRQFKMNLLKSYARTRQVPYFLKSYVSCISEAKTVFSVTPEELNCLEEIFMDISYNQCADLVSCIMNHLDQFLTNDCENEFKAATVLCVLLRSMVFSSPAVLQKNSTAATLVSDCCERLQLLKASKNCYRRYIGDILTEIAVKIYSAVSAYEETKTMDAAILEQSLSKKTTLFPWKRLLSAHDADVTDEKLERSISQFMELTPSHCCGSKESKFSTPCLPGYCFVVAFWRTFLSNFSLFQRFASDELLKKVVDFVRQELAQLAKDNCFLRKSINDFVSTSGAPMEPLIWICDADVNEEKRLCEMLTTEQAALNELKRSVIDKVRNYSQSSKCDLNEIFRFKLTDDPAIIIQKLQQVAFAFEGLESMAKLNDAAKIYFKELAQQINLIWPVLVARFSTSDVALAGQLVAVSLDLFSSMMTVKVVDVAKHPIASVALTCASMVSWDRLQTSNHRATFLRAFESFLKFLRSSLKKCNSVMISLAPNWMGVLRRMQSVLVNLCANCENGTDDTTPVFYRLSRFYSSLDRCKEMEKIAAFFIFDLVNLLKLLKLSNTQRDAFEYAVCRLIGICDSHSISMITTTMDSTSKELFSLMHGNYMKYYRYTGEV